MTVTTIIVASLLFFLFGLLISFVLLSVKHGKKEKLLAEQNLDKLNFYERNLAVKEDRLITLGRDIEDYKSVSTEERREIEFLKIELTKTKTQNNNLEEKLSEQKEEHTNLNKKFQKEFEHISNKLLRDNSEHFIEANKKRITDVLTPFKDRINAFEKVVKDVYIDETKERSELKSQIKELMLLNKSIGEEANNLTNALKGDTKIQGNWGELILERVLENSGLVKGYEYETQFSTTNDEGKRIQPDIVVNLPDKKFVIIDSKVSLQAYEEYMSNTDIDGLRRETLLKKHLLSVRTHIKVLSEKRYETAKGLDSPDFILLFMPLESSFSLALKNDKELYAYAWKHKIVIVSPTTLLATLRTISAIWKQEKQNKNAQLIAEKAGALYDKFVGFMVDLQKMQSGLNTTQKMLDAAMNKMSDGKGNLIKKAEEIRKLGAKTSKEIDPDLLSESNLDE